jgi:hypothetical protein
MRWFVAVFLALGSCADLTPPEKRVTLVLRNSTDQKLEFQTQVGFLGTHLEIPAGYTWRGWVPRDFVAREIFIEIIQAPTVAPRERTEPSEECERED